jgi:GNAT superfamily N-acetyltransferase
MRIAEDQDGVVLGPLVITEIPAAYVPAVAERELYINLLLVSRRHGGQSIGAALIEHAKQEAMARMNGRIVVPVSSSGGGSFPPQLITGTPDGGWEAKPVRRRSGRLVRRAAGVAAW